MSQPSTPQTTPGTITTAYKRVAQAERCDDALACIAMIAGQTLQEVTAVAQVMGYPKQGPAYIPEAMIAKIAMKSAQLVVSDYKDFVSFAALPDLAFLYVDYDEQMEISRLVLWHRPTPSKLQNLSTVSGYIIDPAYWVDPKHQITRDVSHLAVEWYLTVHSAKTQPSKPKA
ncbi:hypothetical protein E8K88_16665 [Lampropedia aestuarii]|uniref:Uncharacterized protein n=1 Tax=Lampropedia aestuarii TaxID=2562762 RepID=A0A4S5BF22_9BURK|nr:hypothetical protein [Lampropedia aestuarii]THJ30904.1 hypothetical protein E8K88_16665 [Lampropedia aestuarii]